MSLARRKFTLTRIDTDNVPYDGRKIVIPVGFPDETAEQQAAGMFYALVTVLPKWPG